jgi:hypothetical protein
MKEVEALQLIEQTATAVARGDRIEITDELHHAIFIVRHKIGEAMDRGDCVFKLNKVGRP